MFWFVFQFSQEWHDVSRNKSVRLLTHLLFGYDVVTCWVTCSFCRLYSFIICPPSTSALEYKPMKIICSREYQAPSERHLFNSLASVFPHLCPIFS